MKPLPMLHSGCHFEHTRHYEHVHARTTQVLWLDALHAAAALSLPRLSMTRRRAQARPARGCCHAGLLGCWQACALGTSSDSDSDSESLVHTTQGATDGCSGEKGRPSTEDKQRGRVSPVDSEASAASGSVSALNIVVRRKTSSSLRDRGACIDRAGRASSVHAAGRASRMTALLSGVHGNASFIRGRASCMPHVTKQRSQQNSRGKQQSPYQSGSECDDDTEPGAQPLPRMSSTSSSSKSSGGGGLGVVDSMPRDSARLIISSSNDEHMGLRSSSMARTSAVHQPGSTHQGRSNSTRRSSAGLACLAARHSARSLVAVDSGVQPQLQQQSLPPRTSQAGGRRTSRGAPPMLQTLPEEASAEQRELAQLHEQLIINHHQQQLHADQFAPQDQPAPRISHGGSERQTGLPKISNGHMASVDQLAALQAAVESAAATAVAAAHDAATAAQMAQASAVSVGESAERVSLLQRSSILQGTLQDLENNHVYYAMQAQQKQPDHHHYHAIGGAADSSSFGEQQHSVHKLSQVLPPTRVSGEPAMVETRISRAQRLQSQLAVLHQQQQEVLLAQVHLQAELDDLEEEDEPEHELVQSPAASVQQAASTATAAASMAPDPEAEQPAAHMHAATVQQGWGGTTRSTRVQQHSIVYAPPPENMLSSRASSAYQQGAALPSPAGLLLQGHASELQQYDDLSWELRTEALREAAQAAAQAQAQLLTAAAAADEQEEEEEEHDQQQQQQNTPLQELLEPMAVQPRTARGGVSTCPPLPSELPASRASAAHQGAATPQTQAVVVPRSPPPPPPPLPPRPGGGVQAAIPHHHSQRPSLAAHRPSAAPTHQHMPSLAVDSGRAALLASIQDGAPVLRHVHRASLAGLAQSAASGGAWSSGAAGQKLTAAQGDDAEEQVQGGAWADRTSGVHARRSSARTAAMSAQYQQQPVPQPWHRPSTAQVAAAAIPVQAGTGHTDRTALLAAIQAGNPALRHVHRASFAGVRRTFVGNV